MEHDLGADSDAARRYARSGKVMLISVVVLLAVVVFMVALHLYAKWYVIRQRRHQLEHRRQRRRTHVVFYDDGHQPNRSPAAGGYPGLEPGVLSSLPVFVYKSGNQPAPECAVCLSEFEENEKCRLLPKCNHTFHIECIDMWFDSHTTCPLCRSPVERVVNRVEVAVRVEEAVENRNRTEPGSTSSLGLSQHDEVSENPDTTPLGERRKAAVRIEIPRMTGLEDELPVSSPAASQGYRSPASRLLSFTRILSMGKKSPGTGGATTPCGAASSGTTMELDLESGNNQGESTREATRTHRAL